MDNTSAIIKYENQRVDWLYETKILNILKIYRLLSNLDISSI
jgi:hypothetical protein